MISFLKEYKVTRTFPSTDDLATYDYVEEGMHKVVYKPKKGNDYIVYINYSIDENGEMDTLRSEILPEIPPAPCVSMYPTVLTNNMPNYAIDFAKNNCYVQPHTRAVFNRQMARLDTLMPMVDEYLNKIVECYGKTRTFPTEDY